MILRVLLAAAPGIAGILAFSILVPAFGQPATDRPDSLAYLVDHLRSLGGKRIAKDLYPGMFDVEPNISDVSAIGACRLDFTITWALVSDQVLAGTSKKVSVNFANAELDSALAQSDRILLRFTVAVPVQSKGVAVPLGSDKSVIEMPSFSENWRTLALPAADEEDARRMARAANDQIKICGGKRDPFAK